MEKRESLKPIVRSPARDAHLRKGKGFSLSEINSANHEEYDLKRLNIKIDYHRKSAYQENINLLKSFEVPKEKKPKRSPFTAKEKKKTGYKPKTQKPKKKLKVDQPLPKKVKPEKEPKEIKEGTPLVELSGLGPATSKKLNDLGVECVEDLLGENPEELAQLVRGCSEKRLKNWIEEGKELISK